jgi:hypothetical protein
MGELTVMDRDGRVHVAVPEKPHCVNIDHRLIHPGVDHKRVAPYGVHPRDGMALRLAAGVSVLSRPFLPRFNLIAGCTD